MQNQEDLTTFIADIVTSQYTDIFQLANKEFKTELDNLLVRTLWDSENHDRYGEYFGVPMDKWSAFGQGNVTPQIVLFAKPILKDFGHDEGFLIKKIRTIILHEIGHHLGLSEIELRERGIY